MTRIIFSEHSKFTLFLAILLSLFSIDSNGQTCSLGNPALTGYTSTGVGVTTVGQSFAMSCADAEITSIEVASLTSHTEVVLKIFQGEGFGGSVVYTQNDIVITGAVDFNVITTITFSTPLSYGLGSKFTMQLSFPAGNASTFQLAKTAVGNFYGSGTLYENGVPLTDQDLKFTVNTNALILPVELSFFETKLDQEQVILNWQTASEQNNEGFEIERSADGRQWEMIGFEAGQGNATQKHDYRFVDEKPMRGNNYYRLRQIDFDGHFDYSNIRLVVVENGETGSFGFYPNPIAAGQMLTLTDLHADFTGVILMDVLGRQVLEQAVPENNNSLQIELPSDLKNGIYLLALHTGNESTVRKLIVK